MGHYEVDADTYANDWQVDYLKVDFCGPTSGGSMRALFVTQNKTMHTLIQKKFTAAMVLALLPLPRHDKGHGILPARICAAMR
jgi:hypothetical protein